MGKADDIYEDNRRRMQQELESEGYYDKGMESLKASQEYERAGEHLLDDSLDRQTRKELKHLQKESRKKMNWRQKALAKDSIRGEKRRQEKTGCYVATEVYGDSHAPQVEFLRRFRDERLKRSMLGRFLISCYYGGLGQGFASFIGLIPEANRIVRSFLDWLSLLLSHQG